MATVEGVGVIVDGLSSPVGQYWVMGPPNSSLKCAPCAAANVPVYGITTEYINHDNTNTDVIPVGGGAVWECVASAAISLGDRVNAATGGTGRIKSAISSYTTSLTGANNDMVFTAKPKYYGRSGDGITIQYTDRAFDSNATATHGQSLSVTVTGKRIKVFLATNSAGTITSTAADIKTLLDGTAAVSDLVSIANSGADTGAGAVTVLAETALSGGANDFGWARAAATAAGNIIHVQLD